jgi:hypothetical protein
LFLKAFAEGSEAKDGQDARMKWAHVDIAGTMDVRVEVVWQFMTDLTVLFPRVVYEAHTIHGEGHDRTSNSVSSLSFPITLRGL